MCTCIIYIYIYIYIHNAAPQSALAPGHGCLPLWRGDLRLGMETILVRYWGRPFPEHARTKRLAPRSKQKQTTSTAKPQTKIQENRSLSHRGS